MTTPRPDEDEQLEAVEELDRARQHRLEGERRMTMSERLATLHALCKQAAASGGSARPQ